jgi:hypothetical protein
VFRRPKKNKEVNPVFPFKAPVLRTRPYLWIMPLWVVAVFLAIFAAMYSLAFLSESAFDHVLKWMGLANK